MLTILHTVDQNGFAVWCDRLLEGGGQFQNETERALEEASGVVLFSKAVVASHWAHDKTTREHDGGPLVPLSLDVSQPPLGFGQFECILMSYGWGHSDSVSLQKRPKLGLQ